ncbi:Limb region 1 -like protein, variant 2 [Balamuthia mandrillaris]
MNVSPHLHFMSNNNQQQEQDGLLLLAEWESMQLGGVPGAVPMGEEPFDSLFYAATREWVVSLVVFLLLYAGANLLLHRFWRKNVAYDEEMDRSFIAATLCTLSLTIAMGAVLLVPVTIISNEIMVSYSKSWYVKWLNRELIFGMWNYIFWGSNLAVFFLLPFAYFYYEAEGLGGKGMLARFYEAVLVFVLVSMILGGLVYLLQVFLYREQASEYLLFTYSLISMLGCLLFLGCAPVGFLTFTRRSAKMFKPIHPRKSLEEQLQILAFEKCSLLQCLQDKELNEGAFRYFYNETSNIEASPLKHRLKEIEVEESELARARHKLVRPAIVQNVVALLYSLVNLLFTVWVLLRVAMSLLRALLPSFGILYSVLLVTPPLSPQGIYNSTINGSLPVSHAGAGDTQLEWQDRLYDFLVMEEAVHAKLGAFECLLESAVIIYPFLLLVVLLPPLVIIYGDLNLRISRI